MTEGKLDRKTKHQTVGSERKREQVGKNNREDKTDRQVWKECSVSMKKGGRRDSGRGL